MTKFSPAGFPGGERKGGIITARSHFSLFKAPFSQLLTDWSLIWWKKPFNCQTEKETVTVLFNIAKEINRHYCESFLKEERKYSKNRGWKREHLKTRNQQKVKCFVSKSQVVWTPVKLGSIKSFLQNPLSAPASRNWSTSASQKMKEASCQVRRPQLPSLHHLRLSWIFPWLGK